jgi:NADPH-dependent F420 reductase
LLVSAARIEEEPSVDENAIAILGGTGDQGLGLALRFALAGRPIAIGSRRPERAVEAAEKVRASVPGAAVVGLENGDAVERAPIAILSVPFEHCAATLKAIRPRLRPGQVVVSMGVPLATAIGDGATRLLGVWQGSCAELLAALAPEGVEVVSAFQNVSAHRLQDLDNEVECDVLVSGPPAARRRVMSLCPLVPGLRAVDAGPLANARIAEAITALLIGLNSRYEVPQGVGIRFTGLPDA